MAVEVGDAFWSIGGDDKPLQNALRGAEARVKSVTTATAQNIKQVGAAMTAAGGEITAAFAVAVKSAADFGGGIAEIATLGVEDLEAVRETVKDVATTFGQDLTLATKAAYQAISAGAAEAELPNVLAASAKAATAGVTDLETAVKLGMGTMNAFGDSVSSIEEVFDSAFIAVKNGTTDFIQLSESIGKLSPLAASAGLSMDEMFASVAAVTQAGIATSEAVTGMRQVLVSIVKPSKDAAELADLLGLEFSTAALASKGLAGFLEDVGRATDGDIDLMARLFGSVEALTPVLALTGAQAGDFAKNLEEMANKAGMTDEAFKKLAAEDPGLAFRILREEMRVLAIEVGESLLPAVRELVEIVTPIVKKVSEWVSENPKLSAGIATVTAGIGALMLVLGPVLFAVGGFLSLLGSAGGAGLTGALGATGAAAAGVIGPIIAIAGAIAVTVGAVTHLTLKFKEHFQATKQIEDANRQAEQGMSRYISILRGQGVEVDSTKVKSMEHADAMKYLKDQTKKAEDAGDRFIPRLGEMGDTMQKVTTATDEQTRLMEFHYQWAIQESGNKVGYLSDSLWYAVEAAQALSAEMGQFGGGGFGGGGGFLPPVVPVGGAGFRGAAGGGGGGTTNNFNVQVSGGGGSPEGIGQAIFNEFRARGVFGL